MRPRRAGAVVAAPPRRWRRWTMPVAAAACLLLGVESATTGMAARATVGDTGCTVNAKLVPSCNVLWGAAAGGLSSTPRDQALREWEAKSGRTASIYHTYHRGDELFPTSAQIAMATEPGRPRLLFTNWKVAYGTTWAGVARGERNARIDRLAAHLRANYRDPFFMAIHHEPDNDVVPTAGSGMTAGDYAAMFRHTARRLRARGVHNAVFVVAYMGIEKFYNQSWWYDLYPGDDVVDWIGLDAYVTAKPGGYHYGTLSDLLNRTTDGTRFPGFYSWHQAHHADKPLMLSEWGVHEYTADPGQKAKILSTVLAELDRFPAVKAMVWFDTAKDQNGADIRIDSSPQSLAEFQKIAADPRFVVRVRGGLPAADRTPPTVVVAGPAYLRRVRGTVTVSVRATDASGISGVHLLVRGRIVSTDTTAPFTPRWSSGGHSGQVDLTVRVYDRAGNVGTAYRRVVVDNRAPSVRLTKAPGHGRRHVRGTATVRAAAADSSGIRHVQLLVNGRVVGTDRSAPYAFRVKTWRYGKRLRVQLRAYDHAGNVRYTPIRTWYR